MILNEFSRYMTTAVSGMVAIKNDMETENKKQIVQHARWAYKKCVKEMEDTCQNIKRWLERKPCLFKHPITGNVIEYYIGADFEALYYFLKWCHRLQSGERVDDGFSAYVAYLISRSKSDSWKE